MNTTMLARKYYRHYKERDVTTVMCYNPFTKCDITDERLFFKKCLLIRHRNPNIEIAWVPANPEMAYTTYYVDEGAYLFERLSLPDKSDTIWII